MLKEIIGALEFAAFLAALAAGCVWLAKLPVIVWLNEKLFGDIEK